MQNTPDFILIWDRYMILGAYFFAACAVSVLLYHEFRIFQIKDNKQKYDYVNLHEITYFWYAVLALIFAVAFYTNGVVSKMNFSSMVTWFYVRMFITVSFIVVAYFIFYSLVRIYYPRYVDRRLSKLRNKPRVSSTGNLMRKLTEAEEESHLEADQFTEQREVHSVDYDVWLDEQTGEKKIEKYISYQHAVECPECGYVTLKISREEIAEAPGPDSPGILIKHFKCSYCSHREAREVVVAALSQNA
jgi:hypothetical protein